MLVTGVYVYIPALTGEGGEVSHSCERFVLYKPASRASPSGYRPLLGPDPLRPLTGEAEPVPHAAQVVQTVAVGQHLQGGGLHA